MTQVWLYRIRVVLRMRKAALLHAFHAPVVYAVLCEANGRGFNIKPAMPDGMMLDAPEQCRTDLRPGDEYALLLISSGRSRSISEYKALDCSATQYDSTKENQVQMLLPAAATASPNSLTDSWPMSSTASNPESGTTRTLARGFLIPSALPFVCLATGNSFRSGRHSFGKPPNQQNGPGSRFLSSNIRHTTQPLGFVDKPVFTLNRRTFEPLKVALS